MFTWSPGTWSIYMDAGDVGIDIFVKPIIFLNFMTEYRYQLLETKEDISKITR